MTDTTDLRHKQQRKSYLQRVVNLQDKFPNVPREVIEESIDLGKNPSEHFENLKSGIIKKNIARGVGKGATKVAGKSILPISILQFLQGSPAGAESDEQVSLQQSPPSHSQVALLLLLSQYPSAIQLSIPPISAQVAGGHSSSVGAQLSSGHVTSPSSSHVNGQLPSSWHTEQSKAKRLSISSQK